MDPAGLRLVGPMHIAETRAQAMENVKYGFELIWDISIITNLDSFHARQGCRGVVRGEQLRRDRNTG